MKKELSTQIEAISSTSSIALAQFIQFYEMNPSKISKEFRDPIVYQKVAYEIIKRIENGTQLQRQNLYADLAKFPRANELAHQWELGLKIKYAREHFCPELDSFLVKLTRKKGS